MIVIGIDPSTKRCGLAAIDPATRELLHVELIESEHDDARLRIREVYEQVLNRINLLDPDLDVEVYLESTVMRGKGGETLARMTGALMATVPPEFHVDLVHNTTMKKMIGGHGKADKYEVAEGVWQWFGAKEERVRQLAAAGEWDQTDAIGIAIAGWERRRQENGKAP